MFFDQHLMESEDLWVAWTAAHQDVTDEDALQLPIICESVPRWVRSRHHHPRMRLSLRTAATLVAGAAKLCLKRARNLLEDACKLDMELTTRRKRPRPYPDDDQTGSEDSNKSPETPEKMMGLPTHEYPYVTIRNKERSFELSPFLPETPDKTQRDQRIKTEFLINEEGLETIVPDSRTSSLNHLISEEESSVNTSNVLDLAALRYRYSDFRTPNNSPKLLPSEPSQEMSNYSSEVPGGHGSATFTIPQTTPPSIECQRIDNMSSTGSLERDSLSSETHENSEEPRPRSTPETRDGNTQTDQAFINEWRQYSDHEFFESVPFGITLVHDNFHSRLPSKIICSSLIEDIKLL